MIKANKEVKKEVKEYKELEEAFVLWKHKSKNGLDYLSGNTKADKKGNKISLVAYFNKNKKNPKEPDIRVYTLDEEGNQDKEVCSLWENTSQSGNKYLSGMTDDKESVVAFYNEIDEESKLPYIRAYYKQD